MKYMLICADVLEGLGRLEDESVDAIVTDPPYELGFMGKKWDSAGIANKVEVWRECLRVLKPGGHMLAFSGARTYHRMVVAIEDAGFEIRDQVMWIFASGFPKNLDVSKAIDKDAGAKREVVGKNPSWRNPEANRLWRAREGRSDTGNAKAEFVTAPATDAAKQWDGWGTALKPAHEPIVLARKPLSEGTIAANVLKHGTGAINIDGCRIVANTKDDYGRSSTNANGTISAHEGFDGKAFKIAERSGDCASPLGRWPVNVIFDEEAGSLLDEQSGTSSERPRFITRNGLRQADGYGLKSQSVGVVHGDSGGASRFFYCAKASTRERNNRLDGVEIVTIESWAFAGRKVQLQVDTAQSRPRVIGVSGIENSSASEWNTLLFGNETMGLSRPGMTFTISTKTSLTTSSKTLNWLLSSHTKDTTPAANSLLASGGSHAANVEPESASALSITLEKTEFLPGVGSVALGTQLIISASAEKPAGHPTVKPIKLMEYLVKLITPPGGTVLDPFMGSGTTGIVTVCGGRFFIGIDQSQEYVDLARRRIRDSAPLLTEEVA